MLLLKIVDFKSSEMALEKHLKFTSVVLSNYKLPALKKRRFIFYCTRLDLYYPAFKITIKSDFIQ